MALPEPRELDTMDFSAHNPSTSNALNMAARNNEVHAVRRLLKKINPNCVDNRGWTCLHEAANADSYECLAVILKHHDCRPFVETFEGYTALYLACFNKCSLKTIQLLLDSGKDIANYSSCVGFTPLHHACGEGRLELIELLLQYGAKLNKQDFDGDTPLHNAVLQEQPGAVAALIKAGAAPEIKNKSGFTPFHLACGGTCFEAVELLYPFVTDINMTTSFNYSALMLATQIGNNKVVSYLLEKGADLYIRSLDRETALDIALCSGHIDVFKTIFYASDRNQINKEIILQACKPHIFKKETLEILLTSDLGPEFFVYTEKFHVVLEQLGDYKPSYKLNAPLNSFLNVAEYLFGIFPQNFKQFFNSFLARGVSVNAQVEQCPPLVYIHYCLHTACFTEVFNILAENGCNIDYCSTKLCKVRDECMPDAFLASLTSNTLTMLTMLPYSLTCDPYSILFFSYVNGILGRFNRKVLNRLLKSIDPTFVNLEPERISYYVPSLKHITRTKIRSLFKKGNKCNTTQEFLYTVNLLPLPQLMKDYIRYVHI